MTGELHWSNGSVWTRDLATDWGNLIGHLDQVPGKIVWDNASNCVRDLAGAWEYNGQATEIQQSGLSLTFINEHGNPSDGHFVDIETVEADDDARSPVNTLTRTAARHYIPPAFPGEWTLEQQAEDRWD